MFVAQIMIGIGVSWLCLRSNSPKHLVVAPRIAGREVLRTSDQNTAERRSQSFCRSVTFSSTGTIACSNASYRVEALAMKAVSASIAVVVLYPNISVMVVPATVRLLLHRDLP